MLAHRDREDGLLEDLTDSTPEGPTPSSTDAARSLARLPSVGSYLVKFMFGVLTLTKRTHFNVGVVPPGSYSSVRYLLTGDPALTSRSLWPWSKDPKARTITLKSLRRWKGAPDKICRGHCAIGLIGAAVLNKAPCSHMGTNN